RRRPDRGALPAERSLQRGDEAFERPVPQVAERADAEGSPGGVAEAGVDDVALGLDRVVQRPILHPGRQPQGADRTGAMTGRDQVLEAQALELAVQVGHAGAVVLLAVLQALV